MAYEKEKRILPMFPKTSHLPINPNASRGDLIATQTELETLLSNPNIIIEEKIDGANSAIAVVDKQPIIRNRRHILDKAYTNAVTPAKAQFKHIWTWYYDNRDKFKKLEKLVGFLPSVYGEWMYYTHTVYYDNLPDYWIAYDIYNSQEGRFLSPIISREALVEAGFHIPQLLHKGNVNFEQLNKIRNGVSLFSSSVSREGVYIKTYDDDHLINRYKMVREGFSQRSGWNDTEVIKNEINKG